MSYFSFQTMLLDWCNKDHGMYYPVSKIVYIKRTFAVDQEFEETRVSLPSVSNVWQWVSSSPVALYHITVNKMC